ncbi:hypothetical protein [Streptomyces chrestomyceticus]|uniref:hypothetical protein n=1 Tax=Streptomyces chrestomyceticus TaxID=68185 RepID=UPI0034081323
MYSRTAKVYETLREHRAAAEQYARAAAARPARTYARIVALDLVAGAEMQLKRGQIEQACATWHRALDHMEGVRSVRTQKAVTTMRRSIDASAPAAYARPPNSTSAPPASSPVYDHACDHQDSRAARSPPARPHALRGPAPLRYRRQCH